MLIVSANDTLMKSETTSNDTIIQPFAIFYFLIFFVNSLVVFTVYRDSLKSFNNCANYFAGWYVAVSIFDIIGLISKSRSHLFYEFFLFRITCQVRILMDIVSISPFVAEISFK